MAPPADPAEGGGAMKPTAPRPAPALDLALEEEVSPPSSSPASFFFI